MRVETINEMKQHFRNMGFLPPAEFLHPGLEERVEVSQSRRNSNCIPDAESTGTQKQQWRILH